MQLVLFSIFLILARNNYAVFTCFKEVRELGLLSSEHAFLDYRNREVSVCVVVMGHCQEHHDDHREHFCVNILALLQVGCESAATPLHNVDLCLDFSLDLHLVIVAR